LSAPSPPFIDWLDVRLEPTRFSMRPWPEPGQQWQRDLPIVGELLPEITPGKTRHRAYCARGMEGQSFFWTPNEQEAFASLSGGWWSTTTQARGDALGWDTLHAWSNMPGYSTRIQRIDVSFHLENVERLVLAKSCQAKFQEFTDGGELTGWTVGSSLGWMLRVYRKDLWDPKDHCKTRFPGLRIEKPWRVEFQLRHSFLQCRSGGAGTAAYLGAWGIEAAWAMVSHILTDKGITIVTRDGPFIPPESSLPWVPISVEKKTLFETLAKQARGCYAQGILAELGFPDVPQTAKQDVLRDHMPEVGEAIDEFEFLLMGMVKQHKAKRRL